MTKLVKISMIKFAPNVSGPRMFYGNPKIHKGVVNNLPKFRPIVSVINTSGYNMGYFFDTYMGTSYS